MRRKIRYIDPCNRFLWLCKILRLNPHHHFFTNFSLSAFKVINQPKFAFIVMHGTKEIWVYFFQKKVPAHYYVSREWLHRLSTFSHPGVITNHDFLCQHAQILPRRAAHLVEHYATIGSALWDFLYEK